MAKQKTNAELTTENEALLKNISDLEKKIDDPEYVKGLEKTIEEQTQVINELIDVQKNLEKGAELGKPAVSVDGAMYEIKVPVFYFNGQRVDAGKLRADEALARHLIKIGSNVLKKI